MGRYDLDNVAKSILDGMNKICYKDDEQVALLLVLKEKVDEERDERAEVEVMPLSACAWVPESVFRGRKVRRVSNSNQAKEQGNGGV